MGILAANVVLGSGGRDALSEKLGAAVWKRMIRRAQLAMSPLFAQLALFAGGHWPVSE